MTPTPEQIEAITRLVDNAGEVSPGCDAQSWGAGAKKQAEVGDPMTPDKDEEITALRHRIAELEALVEQQKETIIRLHAAAWY